MSPRALRIFAVLCLAATYLMFAMSRVEPPLERGRLEEPPCDAYPRGFTNATIALELVESPAEVDCIVTRGYGLRQGLAIDRLVIALYWSILLCLSFLCRQSGLPGSRAVGGAAALAATGGAVADLIENRGMGLLLNGARTQDVIDAVRIASYWKWGLLALAFALVSWFLFRRGWWTWLPAGLCLLAAGWTAYALVVPGALPHLASSVSWMMLALFACVLLFLLHPRSVMRRPERRVETSP